MLTFAPVASSALPNRPPRLPGASPSAPRVEPHHVGPGQQLDIVLGIPVGRVHVGIGARRLTAHVLLRERRALVRRLGLAADEQDRALGPAACAAPRRSRRRRARRRRSGSRSPGRSSAVPPQSISPRRHRSRRARNRPSGPPRRAGSRTARISSPASSTVSGVGDEPGALAEDRDQQAPLRHLQVTDPRPGCLRVLRQLHLDDLEPLLGQVEQVDEAVLRHLVLDQAQDQIGRRDDRLDPEQLEVLAITGVVDPGDDPVDAGTSPSPPGRSGCCPRRRR